MHDAKGRELKLGDTVIIPATIAVLHPSEDYCNVTVASCLLRRPDDARETISAINTGVMLRANAGDTNDLQEACGPLAGSLPGDFGMAIRFLKQGWRVARRGWNGQGMWLALSPGNPALPAEKFWAGPNREFAEANGGAAEVLPSITMKTADGKIVMGWLASQTDMLAQDWFVVD